MKSYELVTRTIKGDNPGRTPVYGWIAWNLDWANSPYKTYTAFEDKYEFDMSHLFGGPGCFNGAAIEEAKKNADEFTPDILLDIPLNSPDNMADYKGIIDGLKYYREERGRFCYAQSNGIFECLNGPLGIENHLMYMALYPEEMTELYKRQTEWNIRFNEHLIELGVDMVHISDDWGAQNSLMFSGKMFREMILPCHEKMAHAVHKAGKFISLHSDGCINEALDGVLSCGYDVVHPWQESAGMSYESFTQNYSERFAILGGLCVQSSLGFGNLPKLEDDIRRVFSVLKGKRWICCTTHFVQDHCSFDELTFAYDLVSKLRV
ncbi:MAG: uroporphyrinogen decarboxylase family protein [Eubacteriales bacterium]